MTPSLARFCSARAFLPPSIAAAFASASASLADFKVSASTGGAGACGGVNLGFLKTPVWMFVEVVKTISGVIRRKFFSALIVTFVSVVMELFSFPGCVVNGSSTVLADKTPHPLVLLHSRAKKTEHGPLHRCCRR